MWLFLFAVFGSVLFTQAAFRHSIEGSITDDVCGDLEDVVAETSTIALCFLNKCKRMFTNAKLIL